VKVSSSSGLFGMYRVSEKLESIWEIVLNVLWQKKSSLVSDSPDFNRVSGFSYLEGMFRFSQVQSRLSSLLMSNLWQPIEPGPSSLFERSIACPSRGKSRKSGTRR
jgi:hypothetical protein